MSAKPTRLGAASSHKRRELDPMPTKVASPKLHLPRLRKATIRHLSIFSAKRVITAEFGDGVFCLAGANGLGKSTFLAAINFGLTGIVSDPGRTFESVEEHHKFTQPFSEDFFTGRVDEEDRDTAEIILEFSVGTHDYKLRRSLFTSSELRDFLITEKQGTRTTKIFESELSPAKLHEEYSKRIASDIGLATFEQFVFLQHFVLTFDERRQLLFWEPKVLDQALFLAFGVDHNDSLKADQLRREAEKQDSLARNYNWQATEARKKAEEIEEMLAGPDASAVPDAHGDLVAKHKALTATVDDLERQIAEWETQLRDAHLKLAEFGARQVALRNEYNEKFSSRFRSAADVAQHPAIRNSIRERACEFCGTPGNAVVAEIERRAKASACCLCGTTRETKAMSSTRDNLEDLKKLDAELGTVKKQHDEFGAKAQRAVSKLDSLRSSAVQVRAELEAFESDNSKVISAQTASSTPEGVQAAIAGQRLKQQEYLDKKEKAYAKRNEKRKDRKRLMDVIEKRYLDVEESFLPMFTSLAQEFLGIELGLSFQRAAHGLVLLLEVKSSPRRHHHQLSESQRFFVDIALRMALAQFMADDQARATLFVDTPEGSLDLAYERRAGVMLANFVGKGNRLIMTANINSSGLLRALAAACGSAKMEMSRMTSWADLSAVQAAEETEFNRAYKEIETALRQRK
ncbi:MAG TPA: AAA family ATPase [Kofleriaceae bacterium]